MIRSLYALFIIFIMLPSVAYGFNNGAIILSKNIIPYRTAADSFKRQLPHIKFNEYLLDDMQRTTEQILEELKNEKDDFILLGIGPEAALLLDRGNFKTDHIFFSMVLNPEKLIKKKKNLSGVSLNMPPEFQLSIIKKAFPKKESIGIFFSGEGNGKLLKYYEDVALKYNMKIVGFPLKSEKEIPMILNSMKFQPDILMFIPDRIVIKEKLINYIIKACIIKKIPVIGFNRWFCKNGAVLSFYLDYGDIGIQTGKLSKRLFKTKSIQSVVEPPKRIRILINIKVADKFNFELSEYIKKSADVF